MEKEKKELTLNDYQEKAMTTCLASSKNFSYMMLNLVGEMGEFASKVAKAIRKDKMFIGDNQLHNCAELALKNEMYNEEGLKAELGDCYWQLNGLCSVMGWKANDICQMNLDKLQARKAAGTINGSGDGVSGKDRVKEG